MRRKKARLLYGLDFLALNEICKVINNAITDRMPNRIKFSVLLRIYLKCTRIKRRNHQTLTILHK